MKNVRLALVLPLALGVLVAAGCGGSDQSVPDNAVAVVDGVAIEKAELDDLVARTRKSYAAQKREFPKAGTPEYQSLQSQVVAYLVQRTEYEKEAAGLGITITDKQIDDRLAELVKTSFGGSSQKLYKQAAAQGYTPAAVRDEVVRPQVLSERIFASVTKDVTVSDADVSKYYADNKGQYQVAESRDVRHILVKTKAEADKLYDQLKAGADFAALAKKYSLDPGSKDQGGKLTVSRGQTVAAFDSTAFLLSTNQLSRPVKTEYGYHLIEPLGAVKPGRVTPLADVKKQIESQLSAQKKNEAIQTWATDVKKKYEKKVLYATGFAPPAAASQPTTTTG